MKNEVTTSIKKPKVSIGVAYYNNEEYIFQCLDSLVNQTLKEIEIIVVNDGSTDSGMDIINSFAAFDSRIKVIDLPENRGVAHAFNVALDHATGEYFTECDSDDWVDLEIYEYMYVKAKEYFDLDFVTCRAYNFTEVSDKIRTSKVWYVEGDLCNTVLSDRDFHQNEKISVWINIWASLYNREFLVKNNIRKLECTSTGTDKSFFVLSRAYAKRFMFTEKFGCYHRLDNPSSLQHRREDLFTNFLILFDEVERELKEREKLNDYAYFLYKFKVIDFGGVLKKIPFDKIKEAIMEMSYVFKEDMDKLVDFHSYKHELWAQNMLEIVENPQQFYVDYIAEQIKVSVIVPVYNDEESLENTINSILNQTFKEIEIILVDDGSTDNSAVILEEFTRRDRRAKLIRSENGGGGAARNVGMRQAKGKYLCFLDADDYFYPNMLFEAYRKAEGKEAEICVWKSAYIKNDTKVAVPKIQFNLDLFPPMDPFCFDDVERDVLRVFNSSVWNKLFLKSFIEENDLQFAETHITNDINFVYSALVVAKRITPLNKVLLDYHTNTVDNSLLKYDLYFKEIVSNWLAFKGFLVERNLFDEKFRLSYIHRTIELIGYCYANVKEEEKRKEYFDYLVSIGLEAFGLREITVDDMFFSDSNGVSKFLQLKHMMKYEKGEYLRYKTSLLSAPSKYELIPLLFATSNDMALPLSAAIISAFENANANTYYFVYVMVDSTFSSRNADVLGDLPRRYGRHSVKIVTIDEALFDDVYLRIGHITYVTYFRLLAPKYFPYMDKIIYMDVDVIITKDLYDLYNTQIEESYIAGVNGASYIYYQGSKQHLKKRLKLSSIDKYINAGVSLFNLRKIRRDGKDVELLRLMRRKYSSMDQDIINVSFQNAIKLLPFKYNAMTKYSAPYAEYGNHDNRLSEIYGEEEFYEGVKQPVIIHYADKLKPWNEFDSFLAEEWFKYASLSPLFNEEEYENYSLYLRYKRYEQAMKEIDFTHHYNIESALSTIPLKEIELIQSNELTNNTERSWMSPGHHRRSDEDGGYRISIIIPVYNVMETIHQTLQSVLINAMILDKCEIIIVDDGSTDNTLNTVCVYANQFQFIKVVEQEHQGSGAARNHGIAIAQGEYIAFMDGDDYYYHNTALLSLYEKAKEEKALICGGSFGLLGIKNRIQTEFEFPYEGYQFKRDGFMEYRDWQYDFGYHRFIYDRKMLIQNNILFPKYMRFQDPPFLAKAMLVAKGFYAIKNVVYVLRLHDRIEWTEQKSLDLLSGLREMLIIAKENSFDKLYYITYKRYCVYKPDFITAMINGSDKGRLLMAHFRFINELDIEILSKFNISKEDISTKTLVNMYYPFVDMKEILQQVKETY